MSFVSKGLFAISENIKYETTEKINLKRLVQSHIEDGQENKETYYHSIVIGSLERIE